MGGRVGERRGGVAVARARGAAVRGRDRDGRPASGGAGGAGQEDRGWQLSTGVIGEISRGSSTAANARKRRLSSRCPPFSLSLSPSPSLSFYLSLPPILRHSSLADAASLFLLLPSPPSAAILFLSVFPSLAVLSVLWTYVNALMGVSHGLLWIAPSKRVSAETSEFSKDLNSS